MKTSLIPRSHWRTMQAGRRKSSSSTLSRKKTRPSTLTRWTKIFLTEARHPYISLLRPGDWCGDGVGGEHAAAGVARQQLQEVWCRPWDYHWSEPGEPTMFKDETIDHNMMGVCSRPKTPVDWRMSLQEGSQYVRGFGGIGGMLRYTVDFQVRFGGFFVFLKQIVLFVCTYFNQTVSVNAMRQLGRCRLRPGRLLSSQNPLYSWSYFTTRTCMLEVLTWCWMWQNFQA